MQIWKESFFPITSFYQEPTYSQMVNRHKFQLNQGRTIYLTAINQWGTYGGLLEGVPTKEMNQRTIEYTKGEAKRLWDGDPYVIEPTETPIELDRDYPFGTPASIPSITCLALFRCLDSVRDETMHYSQLPVIWFQPEYAFPIDQCIMESILAIDWRKLAFDYQY